MNGWMALLLDFELFVELSLSRVNLNLPCECCSLSFSENFHLFSLVLKPACAFDFSPELFDYNQLIGKDTTSTLQHAFNVAHERLGIPRLLDAEGFCFQTVCSLRCCDCVKRPRPFQGRFVICRLGLAMFNPYT